MKEQSPFKNDHYFQGNSNPIIITDSEFNIVDANKASLDILEYSLNDILFTKIHELTNKEEFVLEIENIKELISNQISSYQINRNYYTKNKIKLNVDIIISLIRIDNKNYFSGMFKISDKLKKSDISINEINNLKTILKKSPFIQYIINTKTTEIIYENKNLVEYLGYSKEDMNGLTNHQFLYSIIDKKTKEIWNKSLIQHLSNPLSNKFTSVSYSIKNKKGHLLHLKASTIPLKLDDNNKIIYSYGIIEDITSQVENKNILKKQKKLTLKVSMTLPNFIYLIDIKKQKPIFSNNKCKEIIGYEKDEYYKLDGKKFVHKSLWNDFKAYYDKLYKSKTTNNFEIELYLKHKTNGYRWYLHKTIIYERDRNNKPSKVLKTIEDIHDKKINEIKQKELSKYIKTINTFLPITVYVVDLKNKKLEYSNTNSFLILGYTEEEYLEKGEQIVHPDYLDFALKKSIEIKQSKTNHYTEVQLLLKHKTKGYRWYTIKSKVFKRTPDGKPSHIIEIIEDIHENKINIDEVLDQKNIIKNITDSIDPYIYLYNKNKNEYIFTNFEDRTILGYSKSEFFEFQEDLVHKDYKEAIATVSKSINKGLDKFHKIILIKHKIMGYIWVDFKLIILKRQKDGKVLEILQLIENINDIIVKNKKIKHQKEFITHIAEAIPQFITVYDVNTNECLYTNYDEKLIFGYTKDEYLSYKTSELISAEYIETLRRIKELLKNKSNNRNVYSFDTPLKNKNNKYLWVHVKLVITKRDAKTNAPLQILETIQDIDKNKKAFIKVKEQENFIKNITNSSPNLITIINVKTNKTKYSNFDNKYFLNYSNFDWAAMKDFIIHPKDKNSYHQYISNIINKKEICISNFDLRILDNLNNYIWVSIYTSIFSLDKKSNVLELILTFVNINKSKIAYTEIYKQKKFIKDVTDSIPQYLSVWNIKNNTSIYTNFDKKLIFGYTKQEYIEKGASFIHPDYRYLSKKIGKEILMNSFQNEFNTEFLIKHKNGKYIWVKLKTLITERDKKNRATKSLEIIEDINENKLLYIELEEYKNELNIHIKMLEEQLTKNIELEKFASIAAHDLKEPLRTINNYTQILARTNLKNIDKFGQEILDNIKESAGRMSQLIEDILVFSKIDTLGVRQETLDTNDLLKIVTKDLSSLIQRNKIKIELNNLPIIHADKNQLQQLFQNLITNAIKFTEKKKSTIKISCVEKEGFWEFSIQDEGIGIPEDKVATIFEIFKRLHNRSEYEGQGIGLSICKRIVERHKGKIWIKSKLGEGSTFYFVLPK